MHLDTFAPSSSLAYAWQQVPCLIVPILHLLSQGYRRSTEGNHIWRDVTRIREQMREIEEKRAVADYAATVRLEALNLEAGKGAAKGAKAAAKGRPATAA